MHTEGTYFRLSFQDIHKSILHQLCSRENYQYTTESKVIIQEFHSYIKNLVEVRNKLPLARKNMNYTPLHQYSFNTVFLTTRTNQQKA